MNKRKRYYWLALATLISGPLLWVPFAQIIPWGLFATLMIGIGTDLYGRLTSGAETSQIYKAIIALVLTGVFGLLTIFVPFYIVKFSGITGF